MVPISLYKRKLGFFPARRQIRNLSAGEQNEETSSVISPALEMNLR